MKDIEKIIGVAKIVVSFDQNTTRNHSMQKSLNGFKATERAVEPGGGTSNSRTMHNPILILLRLRKLILSIFAEVYTGQHCGCGSTS